MNQCSTFAHLRRSLAFAQALALFEHTAAMESSHPDTLTHGNYSCTGVLMQGLRYLFTRSGVAGEGTPTVNAARSQTTSEIATSWRRRE